MNAYNSCIDTKNEGVPSRTQALTSISTKYALNYYWKNTHCNNVETKTCQQAHKINEPLIVSSTNASAKPYAVMIKINNAIITNVTMTCTLWSENHAWFTELEPV